MKYLFSFLILAVFFASIVTEAYTFLVFVLLVTLFLGLLEKTGKGIVLRESIAILYVLTCLVMPLVGYEFYSIRNPISKLWVGYMPVTKQIYYSYALPAVTIFCFAITLPLSNDADKDGAISPIILRIRTSKNVYQAGLLIMLASAASSLLTPFLPSGLQFFSNLFYYAGFAGFLYVYFSGEHPNRKLFLSIFLIAIFASALSLGMFTIIAYMGITIFSFFFLGNKTSMLRKLSIFSITIVFFIVLQNTKGAYRKYIWQSNYTDNKALLFADIFFDNLMKGDLLLESNNFFPLYVRANQGHNVAKVMRRIPLHQSYDNGERLAKVFASALVPRFFWPDKPEAGGKFNMMYYAGAIIRGFSTNVGPIGEAYGSFGVIGGNFYMFLLGFFIRWAYAMVFRLASKSPLLICWIPVFFFQITYSAETDTLAILNSLFKTAFFIWMLYKVVPVWFTTSKVESVRMPSVMKWSPHV
jgi:hypothetical protein